MFCMERLIIRRIGRDMTKMCFDLYVKYRYYLICMKLEFFSDNFSKSTQMSNFMKTSPVETELLHVDGGTDRRT
jgi:hypothetical protein